jgi:Mlc titration factor MtfA (ptsG expression regulator)
MMRKIFGWLAPHRPQPIPETLWQATVAALPFLHGLSPDEMARLRALSEQFLAEKEFSAAEPLALTDAICLSIAVQGCLPILNLGLGWYRGWLGIVVYADEFVIPRQIEDEDGIVHSYDEVASGEAWEGGPLLVSWSDAQLAGEGYNVVIHEFAHKLDMLNGEVDGIPPLHPGMDENVWSRVLLDAYDDLCERLENGEDTAIDPYGAEDPSEFFAVASEAFFELPDALNADYPLLYAQLASFYRQDPLARLAPRGALE